jgi:hypothetical protein
MALETAVSYLLALAVPAWLVGEHVVHIWKASDQPKADRQTEEIPAQPSSRVPAKPAQTTAGALS